MLWSREFHWKLVSFLARVTGVAFVIGGIVFSVWGVRLLLDRDAALMVDGIPTHDPFMKAIVLTAGLIVGVLGILLIRARPYRGPK